MLAICPSVNRRLGMHVSFVASRLHCRQYAPMEVCPFCMIVFLNSIRVPPHLKHSMFTPPALSFTRLLLKVVVNGK